jgi:hypothetical protein
MTDVLCAEPPRAPEFGRSANVLPFEKRSFGGDRRVSPALNDEAIRKWAEARHLPDVHLERWLALAPDDRAALMELAEVLRLRVGQFLTAFELLEEISLRERATIATIVACRDVRRILDGAGSAPGRARELIDALRVKRFPRLQRMTARLALEIAALGLPGGIKVVLPKDLSSDDVRIEIHAHGGADLQLLIDAVAQVRMDLGRIADLTVGAGLTDDEI